MALKLRGARMALVMLGCGISVLPMAAAAAQSGADDSAAPAGLDEIIVTARRVSENQQRVPISITTVTGAALEQRNVRSVSDIQFSVPNLQIKQSRTYPTVAEFIIRGQRQQQFTDENVVTYVNGVPQGTRALTLYDIESVQTLKGPQGTLFGKNSNGGAMVFTTKKPEFSTGGMLELEYGNYDRKAATGVLNLPIVADQVALRLAGKIERRDGTFKNDFPGGADLDNRRNESARASLLIKSGSRFENLLVADYLHRRELPNPSVIDGAPLTAAAIPTIVRQAVTLQSQLSGASPITAGGLFVRQGNPFRVRMPTGLGRTAPDGALDPLLTNGIFLRTWGLSNTTSYELSETLTLRNILGYRNERSLDEHDPAGIGGFILDTAPIRGSATPIPGRVALSSTNYTNRTKALTEELQLVGDLPDLKFIVGGFYSHTKFRYVALSYLSFGSFTGRPRQTRYADEFLTTESRALFAQGTYDFGGVGLEGLRLTAGLRHTWDTKDYTGHNFFSTTNELYQVWPRPNGVCNEINGTSSSVTGVNSATECSISGEKTFRALTWTASLEYQVTPRTMIYFANRRGYKAGGVNPTTVNKDFAFFGPERLTDFEVGFKHEGFLGSVPYRLNLAGFIGKYKQIQTQNILTFCSDPTSATCGAGAATYSDLVIFNVGRATIKGIEFEGSVKPFPPLTLDVGYSYQVARYGKGSIIPQAANPGPIGINNPIDYNTGFNLSGKEFVGVPRHQLSVNAIYDVDFVPESFAKARISMSYAYQSRAKGLPALGVYTTPGFGVLGARVSFDELLGSGFSLAFWGQNITNRIYRSSCNDSLNSLAYLTCRWGEPRTYGVTGSVKF